MAVMTREEANSVVAKLRENQERMEFKRKLEEETGLKMAKKRVLECRVWLRLALREVEYTVLYSVQGQVCDG